MKHNLLKFILVLAIAATVFACSNDSEQEVAPVKPEVTKSSNANGRVANSNQAVILEIESLGYVLDSTDVEHYSYYHGGTYEVTMHIRGDVTKDDKYKITYESTGHVGEETLFNGYIPNSSCLNNLLGMISVDGLE